MIHARNGDALEDDQEQQAIAKDVVVQRSEELGGKKGRKAALRKQGKLAWFGH
jgi:hypothetical protein